MRAPLQRPGSGRDGLHPYTLTSPQVFVSSSAQRATRQLALPTSSASASSLALIFRFRCCEGQPPALVSTATHAAIHASTYPPTHPLDVSVHTCFMFALASSWTGTRADQATRVWQAKGDAQRRIGSPRGPCGPLAHSSSSSLGAARRRFRFEPPPSRRPWLRRSTRAQASRCAASANNASPKLSSALSSI